MEAAKIEAIESFSQNPLDPYLSFDINPASGVSWSDSVYPGRCPGLFAVTPLASASLSHTTWSQLPTHNFWTPMTPQGSLLQKI